ncbi:MAG: TerC family protein [Chloroflexi bacterium]|nr:TerC family protein [Chloroflexota bacterium]
MVQDFLWIVFIAVFVVGLLLDLFVFQRKAHVIPVNEALKLVAFWVSLAMGFFILVWVVEGQGKGLEFLTAYLVEYSLSIDNMFVFLALFTYFAVPREAQRKVLLWGILGAIIFRGIFIFAGIALVERFHFLLYVLGVVLLYTAYKLIAQKEKEVNPEENPVVRLARRFIRVDSQYDGVKFFKKIDGLRYATPLFITLVAIEAMDIMFAVDSVPAVFGVTLDPFIVYTSNIFAILGLRALFFALAGLFYLFRYLVYGLSIVLAFIGIKLLIVDLYHIPVAVSLLVVVGLIGASVLASILLPKKETAEAPVLESPPKEK